ncbi:MAG: Hsp33 family molecular chaperone HslO [Paludibacterium sp.]|uniref:Hsp33 family molecular chaperone HslO n=1 Tax=Paludibacterium sp. TaxID=1917523 RepID=UPI0025CF7156|nr:Hsp33 family molecular chaperone HslO [Paludibacterium sp.]MBV8047576.1 Hsp33 family molecular chaperone HslO [Paludibacterium sp.]MBV8646325.1 Hsp33 family molecular chaperone HslO [Paludibacterium sp.]
MSQTDSLQRFLFDEAPVRGALVSLEDTWRHVLSRHTYPAPVRQLLGEMMAAAALLGANLKFDGTLVLQMHGTGVLRLAVVEYTHERTLRATAKWDGAVPQNAPLPALLGSGGRFVLTLEPKVDKSQTWQGIVALEGDTVGAMLENYMLRSEQLDTRLILAADESRAGGLLLQRLPDGHGDPDGWPRARSLADTLKAEELLTLAPLDILHRLYHEETVRVFDEEHLAFACTCSRERVADMLKMVGALEAASILQEQGSVEIGCDFCNQRYVFDEDEVDEIFQMHVLDAAREARH